MDAMTRLQDRTWPAEGAARVPFWVYGDQEVYDREQERIFSGPNWSYVALEAEIPKPYDFVRADIGVTAAVPDEIHDPVPEIVRFQFDAVLVLSRQGSGDR